MFILDREQFKEIIKQYRQNSLPDSYHQMLENECTYIREETNNGGLEADLPRSLRVNNCYFNDYHSLSQEAHEKHLADKLIRAKECYEQTLIGNIIYPVLSLLGENTTEQILYAPKTPYGYLNLTNEEDVSLKVINCDFNRTSFSSLPPEIMDIPGKVIIEFKLNDGGFQIQRIALIHPLLMRLLKAEEISRRDIDQAWINEDYFNYLNIKLLKLSHDTQLVALPELLKEVSQQWNFQKDPLLTRILDKTLQIFISLPHEIQLDDNYIPLLNELLKSSQPLKLQLSCRILTQLKEIFLKDANWLHKNIQNENISEAEREQFNVHLIHLNELIANIETISSNIQHMLNKNKTVLSSEERVLIDNLSAPLPQICSELCSLRAELKLLFCSSNKKISNEYPLSLSLDIDKDHELMEDASWELVSPLTSRAAFFPDETSRINRRQAEENPPTQESQPQPIPILE